MTLTIGSAVLAAATGYCAMVLSATAATLDSPRRRASARSAAGVAPFKGRYLGTWAGQSCAHGYEPGPYVKKAPLFEVTAANAIEPAGSLTDGQKGLLRQYSKAFRMKVYTSHRDEGVVE